MFFGTAGTLLYAWILYPLVLAVLPSRLPRPRVISEDASSTESYPFISLVIAAYNEEDAIQAKIMNFLENSYPGRSELLIVSDGSTDRTVEIGSRFIGERVRLVAESTNRGKGAALARVLPMAQGRNRRIQRRNVNLFNRCVEPSDSPLRRPRCGAGHRFRQGAGQ